MLVVAVHGDDPVIAPAAGIAERVDQAATVALILRVADHRNSRQTAQYLGRPVRRAVVDDQDLVREPPDLREDPFDVALLIEHRDGNQYPHELPLVCDCVRDPRPIADFDQGIISIPP